MTIRLVIPMSDNGDMRCAVYGCKSIPEAAAYALIAPALVRVRPDALWFGGGPRGVDQAVLEWSARAAIGAVTQRVDWQKYGDQAGEMRGRAVAEWCDLALIAWDPGAPETDGTLGGLVRESLVLGKQVVMLVTGADWQLARTVATSTHDKAEILAVLSHPRIPRRRAA